MTPSDAEALTIWAILFGGPTLFLNESLQNCFLECAWSVVWIPWHVKIQLALLWILAGQKLFASKKQDVVGLSASMLCSLGSDFVIMLNFLLREQLVKFLLLGAKALGLANPSRFDSHCLSVQFQVTVLRGIKGNQGFLSRSMDDHRFIGRFGSKWFSRNISLFVAFAGDSYDSNENLKHFFYTKHTLNIHEIEFYMLRVHWRIVRQSRDPWIWSSDDITEKHRVKWCPAKWDSYFIS
jgi:hypothetical protein